MNGEKHSSVELELYTGLPAVWVNKAENVHNAYTQLTIDVDCCNSKGDYSRYFDQSPLLDECSPLNKAYMPGRFLQLSDFAQDEGPCEDVRLHPVSNGRNRTSDNIRSNSGLDLRLWRTTASYKKLFSTIGAENQAERSSNRSLYERLLSSTPTSTILLIFTVMCLVGFVALAQVL